MKVQCQVFSTTYNPEGIRMGNKILRQRLRGPSLAKYYPPKGPTINTLEKEFRSLELETLDEEEDDRQEHLAGQVACVVALCIAWEILTKIYSRRQRGKGAPKKKRTAPGMNLFRAPRMSPTLTLPEEKKEKSK
ncbi:hypothetical protein RRF57_012441 [Xylaria bambusicola]|uniref:Small ribosomal subunit protein mS33 n=1 Tax=Xylaria bambusicola TaxID=326684 RepID=A0AAN7UY12_9PEZI